MKRYPPRHQRQPLTIDFTLFEETFSGFLFSKPTKYISLYQTTSGIGGLDFACPNYLLLIFRGSVLRRYKCKYFIHLCNFCSQSPLCYCNKNILFSKLQFSFLARCKNAITICKIFCCLQAPQPDCCFH